MDHVEHDSSAAQVLDQGNTPTTLNQSGITYGDYLEKNPTCSGCTGLDVCDTPIPVAVAVRGGLH